MARGFIFAYQWVRMLSSDMRHHKIKALRPTHAIITKGKTNEIHLRNIGVIAHIDAGKTTTTERMLYLGGAIEMVGNVDSGDTITDFMIQERQRGITIQSAVISFNWSNCRLNLIDTPGHVDFTVEVERCLRVTDGVMMILDGSMGVEAQTMTVWRQADKFHIPSVIFINKLDKSAASFDQSLHSIESKLSIVPLPLYAPKYRNGKLIGLLDIGQYPVKSMKLSEEEKSECSWRRDELYSKLAELDETFANKFIQSETLDFDSDVRPAIRRCTLERKAVAVCPGSALRNIGVRNVLDMIRDYLPSPIDLHYGPVEYYANDLCALVFKVTHDKRRGPLTYVRIYSGQIRNQMSLYNVSRHLTEHNIHVHIAHSDQLQDVEKILSGNICVLTGLKGTSTGDTLVKDAKSARKAAHAMNKDKSESDQDSDELILAGISPPDPVFFCSIEPPSDAAIHKFEKIIAELAIEDPSLYIRFDRERAQTVIGGQGQLHMEIVKERLMEEYGLDVFMGPLQVAYREQIAQFVEHTTILSETVGGKDHFVSIGMSVAPYPGNGLFKNVEVHLSPDCVIRTIGRDWMTVINEGCRNALFNGPILGFPVHDIYVSITHFAVSGGRVSLPLIGACSTKCLTESLQKASASVLEPMMILELSAHNFEGSSFASEIIAELCQRRGQIVSVDGDGQSMQTIKARAPLAELTDFSSEIRKRTSGLASIHMQFDFYDQMTADDQSRLFNTIKSGRIL